MPKYDINMRDYWRIIRKRRTVVILSIIIFTAFSYLFAVVRTPEPIYEGTSAVKVEKATDLTTLLLGTVSWTSWDNVATQAVIITSFPVIEEAARQMGLIPESVSSAQVRSTHNYLQVVNGLKSNIATEQEGNTNIINITATSSNGAEAALLANTVAEVYRQNNVDERNKKVRETREFIEQQLEVVESRLQQAEHNLRNYEKDTKLVAIDAQTSAVINRLISIENEVTDLQQRRGEVKRQLGLLQQFRAGKQVVSEEAFFVENPSPQLAKLIAKLRDLSLRREILLNDYTKEHPEVDAVDAELANVLSEMDKELRSMLTTMGGRLQDLRKRLEAAREQAMAIPDSALTLARLHREVELNGELLTQLKSKYQEVIIQESGLIEEVKIIKPALEPTSPINMPSTLMNTFTGSVIGVVAGLVLALIAETMDTSLGTIEDVEEILGVPVLGVIPSIQEFSFSENNETGVKTKSEPLVTHFAPRSAVSEAYRSLRTNLQFIRADKKAKAYLITSSSLQEGKTYNVVNLSLSLAQAGEKVLLIDADLRRPATHTIFGLERQPGITDFIIGTGELEPRPDNTLQLDTTLTFNFGHTDNGWQGVTNTIIDLMLGELGIDDILKTPGMDNLHIINAGQGLLNPVEILRSPRFKEFLHEVREHYDIIVIDTPPVLPVADAFEVAPEVDGVILVYEVGRIGRGILKRAKVQLENVNTNVLGVILNNVKPDVAPDFYSYRTDYYYSEKDRDQESAPPRRWRETAGKPLRTFQNIIGKMLPALEAKGKRTAIALFLLLGFLAVAGLAWQSYPIIRSAFQSRPDEKKFGTQNVVQGKPILTPSLAQKEHSETARSDVSPAAKLQKTNSIATPPQGQMIKQKEIKPDQRAVSHIPIRPPEQSTRDQMTGKALVVASTPVEENRPVSEKELAEAKVESPESSIEDFVEKWRRSWEDGDLQAHILCYHPNFKAYGMDIQAWKDYKREIFNRTPERDIKISDIEIQMQGRHAVVTFKQRYQTRNYKDFGLKMFQFTKNQGRWAILGESYESLSKEHRLAMVEDGVLPVKIEALPYARKEREAGKWVQVYEKPANHMEGDFTIQVGAFAVRENAMRLHNSLSRKYSDASVMVFDQGDRRFYRVRVGCYSRPDQAKAGAKLLQKQGFPNAFAVARDK
jgi:capsular exopolysaccharide synthesis family protein